MYRLVFTFLVLCVSSVNYGQLTYNATVHSGLDELESELPWDEIAGLQQNAELQMIFNDVNHMPCTHPIVCVYAVDKNDQPAKKFRLSILDDEGDYSYTVSHKREPSSYWIDESLYGKISYDVVVHSKKKIASYEMDKALKIEIDHTQCAFIFKKVTVPSK